MIQLHSSSHSPIMGHSRTCPLLIHVHQNGSAGTSSPCWLESRVHEPTGGTTEPYGSSYCSLRTLHTGLQSHQQCVRVSSQQLSLWLVSQGWHSNWGETGALVLQTLGVCVCHVYWHLFIVYCLLLASCLLVFHVYWQVYCSSPCCLLTDRIVCCFRIEFLSSLCVLTINPLIYSLQKFLLFCQLPLHWTDCSFSSVA